MASGAGGALGGRSPRWRTSRHRWLRVPPHGLLDRAAAPAGFGLVEEGRARRSDNAIAAVTTVGYSGFVWSPPIFAWLAQAFDLRAAMGRHRERDVRDPDRRALAPRDRSKSIAPQ
jgi:hypothetical protein